MPTITVRQWSCGNLMFGVASVITIRNSSCGKGMFLHLSVSHSVHRGCLGRHPSTEGHPPPPRRPMQRTVRILLECILVQSVYRGEPLWPLDLTIQGPPWSTPCTWTTHPLDIFKFVKHWNPIIQPPLQICSKLFIMKHVRLVRRQLVSYLNVFLFQNDSETVEAFLSIGNSRTLAPT